MLEFSDGPPLESTRYALRLLRTPARGRLHLISTSDNLVGCWTHYYAGRTTPCTGPDCEACGAGASSRWHGYLTAWDPETREHLLFECTAAAAESLAAYRVKHATLRGCEFIASRVSPRPNARIRIQAKPADLSAIDLPQAANLVTCLCHIWGIPTTETRILPGPAGQPRITHLGTQLPEDRGKSNGHQATNPAKRPEARQ
jgi:hypothetical protein